MTTNNMHVNINIRRGFRHFPPLACQSSFFLGAGCHGGRDRDVAQET
jgi:hypothetical protein